MRSFRQAILRLWGGDGPQFNKEVIESGAVTIHYVPTADNIADLYTKAVSKQVLDKLLARALGYHQAPTEDSSQQ